jgi:hypothetical protein
MSNSVLMIDTDSALYGRRLVREIRKNSKTGVYLRTIGSYRVYYAEFTGHSIQIRTTCKRGFQLAPDEWATAFSDRRGRNISANRHPSAMEDQTDKAERD